MSSTQQQCVYCGRSGEITRDHIPPKNLFPEPRPSDLITIPSCGACNSSFAEDDEYFRTIVACTEESAPHPEAKKLWKKKILRQLHRAGGSAIPELIRQSFGNSVDVTESQIHEAEIRIGRTLVRIVKGLHYVETNSRLPISYEVKFNLNPNFEDCGGLALAISVFEAEQGNGGRDIGNGVFRYRMAKCLGEQSGSVWLLVFFERLPFLCTITPCEK